MSSDRCQYVAEGADPGLYVCTLCGHKARPGVPIELVRRVCPAARNAGPPDPAIVRRVIEGELQQRVERGEASRSMAAIRATLDRCFGGCRRFNGWHCTREGTPCRQRANWLDSLAAGDCEQQHTEA